MFLHSGNVLDTQRISKRISDFSLSKKMWRKKRLTLIISTYQYLYIDLYYIWRCLGYFMQWQILMTLWTMPCLLEFIGCGKITLSHRYRTCFPLYEILTSLWLLTEAQFDLTIQMDPGPTTKLLDVAGGTGDIAFRFMNKVCLKLWICNHILALLFF